MSYRSLVSSGHRTGVVRDSGGVGTPGRQELRVQGQEPLLTCWDRRRMKKSFDLGMGQSLQKGRRDPLFVERSGDPNQNLDVDLVPGLHTHTDPGRVTRPRTETRRTDL